MAENPRYARRGRTHFSEEQLQALKRVLEETMYPDWATMEDLISITHLDEWGSPWDSQPPVLQEICLGDFDPPWASSPYDMGQLIQLYALPGDDDPSSLDQYLSPTCRS
ncbi:paired-like homeodomain transcription factor LEUTX [Ursus americanus]|uniref:paired-like homeodomain transcription factor LEUTX n=1 Tax=Ursus americanus TaxID=9643 RepID=UPI001E679367|nr:paired-like homeodomain transcription factor LEUTX [Ursus americanus]